MKQAGGSIMQNPISTATSSTSTQLNNNKLLWSGNLRIQWEANEVIVPCSAHHQSVPGYSPLLDTRNWPNDLVVDTNSLTAVHKYFALMTEEHTQWFARIVSNQPHPALGRVIDVMSRRGTAFEIDIGGGTLFLWAVDHLGLCSVYRPTPPPPPTAGSLDLFAAAAAVAQVAIPYQALPRPSGAGIWTGFLQVRLRERAENLYVSACQSNVSRDFGILDTSAWPFNMWCAPSNMLVSSPLLDTMNSNSEQWIVRFVAATPSDSHTQNALRSLAVYMQARRLMFEISCGTLNGDELMLCLFGVVHSSYGNSIVGGFRVDSGFDEQYQKKQDAMLAKCEPKPIADDLDDDERNNEDFNLATMQ